MTEEAKVTLDGKELEVKDFSDQQKYLYNQIVDLKTKQGRINFELDQINASLSVFENAFKESFKEESEEETETRDYNAEFKDDQQTDTTPKRKGVQMKKRTFHRLEVHKLPYQPISTTKEVFRTQSSQS